MVLKTRMLRGLPAFAGGESVGRVEGLLLDDRHWTARFVVIDSSGAFRRRKVIVPRASVKFEDGYVRVAVARKELDRAPQADAVGPSRRPSRPDIDGSGGPVGITDDLDVFLRQVRSHLWNTHDLLGYHVLALDGERGRVADVLLDLPAWRLSGLVITLWRLFAHRQVVAAAASIDAPVWEARTLLVNLSRTQVDHLPPFSGAPASRGRGYSTHSDATSLVSPFAA